MLLPAPCLFWILRWDLIALSSLATAAHFSFSGEGMHEGLAYQNQHRAEALMSPQQGQGSRGGPEWELFEPSQATTRPFLPLRS